MTPSHAVNQTVNNYLKAIGISILTGLLAATLVKACVQAEDEPVDAAVVIDAGAGQ